MADVVINAQELQRKQREIDLEILVKNKKNVKEEHLKAIADLGKQLPGYPSVAEFIASDERWFMCRRFRALQARLILERQDEMRQLEEEIEAFDREDFMRHDDDDEYDDPLLPWRLTSRGRNNDVDEAKQRRQLMDRAEQTFKEYAELAIAAKKLACLQRPAKYEYDSVSDFIWKTKPLRLPELYWMHPDNKPDIISLRGASEHATVGAVLETIINRIKASKLVNPTQGMQEWLKANQVTEKLAEQLVNGFLIMLVPIMFVIPIYALSRIGDNIGKSIGVLLAFALVFTFFLAIGTPAKPHEILSGSAAYLAVLVVFTGSVNSGRTSP